MPEVTLKFNLPEEQAELDLTLRAGKYHSVLTSFAERLRSWRDGDSETLTVEEVHEEFWNLVNETVGDLYD